MKTIFNNTVKTAAALGVVAVLGVWAANSTFLEASSHREAPLIANDPLADNTDLYAFVSPNDPNSVTIIANYIPLELPEGGPNYASFGEDIRYEIHIENDGVSDEDIIYRFTFSKTNQDPTTFFNIRLGKENLKTTYKCEKSTNGGITFTEIKKDGIVPPINIGPRSIQGGAGLNAASYESLWAAAVTTATTGEKLFCGPSDDAFFVDLGGIFDVGNFRKPTGTGAAKARDAVAKYNTHSIAIQVPIAMLQKTGKTVNQAANILDSDYIIGVWASASRQAVTTLNTDGTKPSVSGNFIQVSRLGMPLTNEAVMPIGEKDLWNVRTPYNEDKNQEKYFTNPELALYMDNDKFGGAVPGLSDLRIQRNSLNNGNPNSGFDFGNTKDGLSGLLANNGGAGTALDTNLFGKYLLRKGQPRSVDILPIFHTGVPNLRPYQLATGKNGNPLAAGKPFINNFLPIFGDMLRLNMAVPATPRNSADFSNLGIVQAAVLGLTDPRFNANTTLQNIPNMDGFPNGRRLEDDVTTIELQAVSGVALAAIGLWYDDYTSGGPNPVTAQLGKVLGFKSGPVKNDTTFRSTFPYVQLPWAGTRSNGAVVSTGKVLPFNNTSVLLAQNYPNPFNNTSRLDYKVVNRSNIDISLFDINGKKVATLASGTQEVGTYSTTINAANFASGNYFARLNVNGQQLQTVKVSVVK